MDEFEKNDESKIILEAVLWIGNMFSFFSTYVLRWLGWKKRKSLGSLLNPWDQKNQETPMLDSEQREKAHESIARAWFGDRASELM